MKQGLEGLGERVKDLRGKMSQKQLADAVNATAYAPDIGQSHISEIENGKAFPSVGLLAALAEVLDASTDFFVGRTEDPDSPIPSDEQAMVRVKDPGDREIVQGIAEAATRAGSEDKLLIFALANRIASEDPRPEKKVRSAQRRELTAVLAEIRRLVGRTEMERLLDEVAQRGLPRSGEPTVASVRGATVSRRSKKSIQ